MLTDEQLDHIEALADHATDTYLRFNRYDHGGGRMFSEQTPEHTRRLIIDAYNECDREFYFSALENVRVLLAEVRRLQHSVACSRFADALRHFQNKHGGDLAETIVAREITARDEWQNVLALQRRMNELLDRLPMDAQPALALASASAQEDER